MAFTFPQVVGRLVADCLVVLISPDGDVNMVSTCLHNGTASGGILFLWCSCGLLPSYAGRGSRGLVPLRLLLCRDPRASIIRSDCGRVYCFVDIFVLRLKKLRRYSGAVHPDVEHNMLPRVSVL